MRVTVWVFVAALIVGPAGQGAWAQSGDSLSLSELAIADCVGQALALEQALRELPGHEADRQAATARADALLNIAVTRYVGVGRVEAFRRRAALAMSAEALRMRTAAEITGSANSAIDRVDRDFERGCGTYLDAP